MAAEAATRRNEAHELDASALDATLLDSERSGAAVRVNRRLTDEAAIWIVAADEVAVEVRIHHVDRDPGDRSV